MSPRKLTSADKEELLVAYRDTAETTSTLAERYGVSSSTISRFLKSRLSGEEYEDLIQKKRLGRSNSLKKAKKSETSETSESKSKPTVVEVSPKQVKPKKKVIVSKVSKSEPEVKVEGESAGSEGQDKPQKRRTRSRRSRPTTEDKPLPLLQELEEQQDGDRPEVIVKKTPVPVVEEKESPVLADDRQDRSEDEDAEEINPDLLALAQEIRLGDRQQALKDLLGDDIDDDDLDDEDDEEDYDDDDGDEEELDIQQRNLPDEVQILPLTEASFPRTCYVVTDRMSELIARPLKEFRELGHIPDEETSQRTLPIFDNHRVAKRFTHGRSQKVIKVPDSRLFLKTSNCLTAKGITRVLLDGQVYDVSRNTANASN